MENSHIWVVNLRCFCMFILYFHLIGQSSFLTFDYGSYIVEGGWVGYVFLFFLAMQFFNPSSNRAGQMVIERLALLSSANKWSLLLPLPRGLTGTNWPGSAWASSGEMITAKGKNKWNTCVVVVCNKALQLFVSNQDQPVPHLTEGIWVLCSGCSLISDL